MNSSESAGSTIFAKHSEGHPEPDAQEFMNKYGENIPCVQQGLPIITVKDLRDALNRIPSSGAGGLDGWKPGELKQLPNQMLEMLLLLFDLVEDSGVWCEALAWAGITLIPKGEGSAPLSLRPITVTPIVYRLWASVRMKHSNPWQESWIHRNQHGAKAKHSTIDALAKISLYLERALQDGDPGFGIAVDLAKAFDIMCQYRSHSRYARSWVWHPGYCKLYKECTNKSRGAVRWRLLLESRLYRQMAFCKGATYQSCCSTRSCAL